jgi:hypothetical protein
MLLRPKIINYLLSVVPKSYNIKLWARCFKLKEQQLMCFIYIYCIYSEHIAWKCIFITLYTFMIWIPPISVRITDWKISRYWAKTCYNILNYVERPGTLIWASHKLLYIHLHFWLLASRQRLLRNPSASRCSYVYGWLWLSQNPEDPILGFWLPQRHIRGTWRQYELTGGKAPVIKRIRLWLNQVELQVFTVTYF